MKFFLIFTFLVVLSVFTQDALACPVCFSATGGTVIAFRNSTFFLSVIPLLFIGGTIFWIYHKYKKSDL